MNRALISTLILKDLTLFFRNRFFAFITVLGLLAYIGIYFLMPRTVNEHLEIGFSGSNLPAVILDQLEQEGVIVQVFESEEALKLAMEAGEFVTGVALPADWVPRLMAGQKDQVKIYFTADFPADLKQTYVILIQELAFLASGQSLNIDFDEQVLGVDRVGAQIPPRERMLPLLAVFILMMETMGLASLITTEIESGTLRAVLTTPLRVEGLFLGKGMTGVGLTFSQVFLLLAVTGGLNQQPVLILIAIFLGSVLVTGIGFLLSTVSRDMMSVLGWGMLSVIILALPAFGVLLPGTVSEWVKVIPSYYLVDTLFQVSNFDIVWGDVVGNLIALAAFSVAFLGLGVWILRRKLA